MGNNATAVKVFSQIPFELKLKRLIPKNSQLIQPYQSVTRWMLTYGYHELSLSIY